MILQTSFRLLSDLCLLLFYPCTCWNERGRYIKFPSPFGVMPFLILELLTLLYSLQALVSVSFRSYVFSYSSCIFITANPCLKFPSPFGVVSFLISFVAKINDEKIILGFRLLSELCLFLLAIIPTTDLEEYESFRLLSELCLFLWNWTQK